MICRACDGACSALQLLLPFWIPLAYANLAGLKAAWRADPIADISEEAVPTDLRKQHPPFFSWW